VPALQLDGGLSLHDAAHDDVRDVTWPEHPFDVLPPPASTSEPQQTSPMLPHSPEPDVPAQLTA